jgi:phosphohistidine phosphatase
MRVLVIRHAQAVPQGTRDLRDADRPLTADGERRFRATALALARIVPKPDVLLTSPLLRAHQTARLLAAAWTDIEPTLEPALASGSVDAILGALEQHARGATVVLVGHEPTVSALLGELLGVISSEAIVFEPGAAALLEVSSLGRHSGRLVWFLPPDLSQ